MDIWKMTVKEKDVTYRIQGNDVRNSKHYFIEEEPKIGMLYAIICTQIFCD
jgi:hypothetical protein